MLATLAVAVTVALATAVLVVTLVSSVRANMTTTLDAYAASMVRSSSGGTWPATLPAAPNDPGLWAQVVDPSGAVVAATANVKLDPALYTVRPGSTAPEPTAAGATRGEERVVVQRHVVGTTPVVVYAGGSTRLLSILTHDLQGHLLYAVPLVILAAVAISWLLIGRTLRPVERIRAEAAEITGSDLHRRIPEPGGQDEIGRLARTLNTMLDRLEDSAARQRRFVADASHELRTPLATVRTSLEVGLAHQDRAPWPELAQRAVTETTRLQRLVDALLLLARYDDSAPLTRRERLDLAALARDVVATVPAGVPVEVELDEAVQVSGDPDQLSRLLRNLLDNAVRYASTRISVTISTDRPDTLIQVADDGPGVPAADRERIFDRFVRLEAARTRHRGDTTGTGLGLSIARDIATAHGGSITVTDPTAGPGALFVVRLPTAL